MTDELAFVRWIRDQLSPAAPVMVGVGDDAAVLEPGGSHPWLITTDTICEGVDFHLSQAGPRRVGRKAVAVTLSDIAAMAGDPTVLVASVAATKGSRAEVLEGIFLGMKEGAEEFGVQIVGGDCTAWDGELAVTVTCLGRGVPVLRSGAVPGDAICVTGSLGGSSLGKHLSFTPRLREASILREKFQIHSMIDVSDGLARDLHHIVEASAVGAEIDEEAIPISPEAQRLASQTGRTPMEHALGDGEDFELLFSLSQADAAALVGLPAEGMEVTRIGRVVETGCFLRRGDEVHPLAPMGFVHEFR